MELLVATTNPHKLDEVWAVLGPLGVRIVGLDVVDCSIEEPVEDQATFEGNARLKAVHYARASGRACLADDSGLEVDALGGRPGVYSARYAGVGATREDRDAANNAKLLEELKGVGEAERTARFVCAMCVVDADGQVIAEARGTLGGWIGDEPRGSNGFGYDPLLMLEDGRTSAELSAGEKNERSHRGEAARLIAAQLRRLGAAAS